MFFLCTGEIINHAGVVGFILKMAAMCFLSELVMRVKRGHSYSQLTDNAVVMFCTTLQLSALKSDGHSRLCSNQQGH